MSSALQSLAVHADTATFSAELLRRRADEHSRPNVRSRSTATLSSRFIASRTRAELEDPTMPSILD